MKNTVIIIGAGAAGLMAARILSGTQRVTVLEARNRTGGRIHTLNNTRFFKHSELGAEFVHGELPATLKLLREAKINTRLADAEMWRYENGSIEEYRMIPEHWELLIKKLNGLQKDTNIYDFLQLEFHGDKYGALRRAVCKFVSGYDTAAPRRASAFALRDEWQNGLENGQYRVEGGYCSIINYLADECRAKSCEILLNSVAKDIHWKTGYVKVVCEDGATYEAAQLLVAMPLGVLQASKQEKGTLTFQPEISAHGRALQQMGFGAVIKILLEFSEAFWLDQRTEDVAGKSVSKMGYLLSDEEIPTWWTQVPDRSKVLTGWIGGPAAAAKIAVPDAEILEQGLVSLATIFKRDVNDLKGMLIARCIMNWTADPYTRGSYAYDTVEAPIARKVLNKPIENTIFFTGEYLYGGTAMGTVEAALTNGEEVALKMLKC